jgi:hypothetical protein
MNDLDLEAIQKRVEKRLKERAGFFTHFAIYIGVNLFLWFIWLVSSIDEGRLEEPFPLFIMFIWGIFLAIHGVSTFLETSRFMENMRQRAFEEELERERARIAAQYPTKAKRTEGQGSVARLSDDGELIYENEYEDDEDSRGTAQRR